eukprot:gene31035-38358_t
MSKDDESSGEDSDDYGSDTEMEIAVETSETWKNKGNDFYKIKSYREAIAAYTQAIELDPQNAALYTNRAAASLMLAMYKETVADCDLAIGIDGNNAKAYFRKVTALKALGRLQPAIDALKTGLALDPGSATAMKDLEVLTTAQKDIKEVQALVEAKNFRVALTRVDKLISTLGTNFRELNLLKVECLIEVKRPEDAYNLTNTMMRTAMNGDVELLRLRAQVFYTMGDIENSFKHLQQAVRADPDNLSVRKFYKTVKLIDETKNAGDTAFKAGRTQEAIDSWSECIDLTKDNRPFACKLYLNRAIALTKLKDYKQAIKDCNVAIIFNHAYTKAYLKRAELHILVGGPENIQKGIEDYEKLLELEQDEEKSREYQQKIKKAKVALKRSKRKDLYAILGVEQSAAEADIKKAHRKGALLYHPDKQSSKSEEEKKEAETTFKAIGEAYEVLSNPETKERYDSGVEVEDLENPHAGGGGHSHGGGGMHGGHGGMDPNILFQMFMQQQQQQQGRR